MKVLEVVWFVLCLIPAIPFLLFQVVADCVRGGIERCWPESARARTIGWWVGHLGPFVLMFALLVVMMLLFLWAREQRRSREID